MPLHDSQDKPAFAETALLSAKANRHAQIARIIGSRDIATQEELTDALRLVGIIATQATISRDIKEMALRKESSPRGGFRYSVPQVSKPDMLRLAILLGQTIISIDKSQNIIVIKTTPGSAHTAGEVVDNLDIPEVLGCLAGDNTCMVITRKAADAPGVIKKLGDLIATAEDRLKL